MRMFMGGVFLLMGFLSLFTDENMWYSMVDFTMGYLLLEDEK